MFNDTEIEVCDICGESHKTEDCFIIGDCGTEPVFIEDTTTLSRARLSLPASLEVEKLADGCATIIAKSTFIQGTQFGPFVAKKVSLLPPEVTFPIKVFGKTKNDTYYLDTSDENYCNWMCLVAPATNPAEQNLICFQMKQDIFYTVSRNIRTGNELRVWYAPYYASKMGNSDEDAEARDQIHDHNYKRTRKTNKDMLPFEKEAMHFATKSLTPYQLGAKSHQEEWKCKSCDFQCNLVTSFASHLMNHFKPWKFNKLRENTTDTNSTLCVESLDTNMLQSVQPSEEEGEGGDLERKKSDFDKEDCQVKETGSVISKEEITDSTKCFNLSESGIINEEIVTEATTIMELPETTSKCVTRQLVKNKNISSSAKLHNPLLSNDNESFTCDICGKMFRRVQYLYRHLRKHTGEFVCVICLQVFSRKENLLGHACLGTPSTPTTFPCTFCKKLLPNLKLLKKHVDKHTGDLRCSACEKLFATRSEMENHDCTKPRMESLQPAYPCKVCGKGFQRRTYLERHLTIHSGKYICVLCGKNLRTQRAALQHDEYCQQAHNLATIGMAMCNCGANFVDISEYRQHVYEHTHPYSCVKCKAGFKSNKAQSFHMCQAKRVLHCELCSKEFNSLSSLNRHQLTHGEHKHHCFECGRSYHRAESLAKHPCEHPEDTKVKKPPNRTKSNCSFVCELCGHCYGAKNILTQHMVVHGKKNFVCDICNKRFHRKDLLREHCSVHEDAKFSCSDCDKKYKTKKSLQIHQLIHRGIKRFECTTCGKKFGQKINLQKHLETHKTEGEKSRHFLCSYCGKSFGSQEYLTTHTLSHTQGKIHQCDTCGKGYLKSHLLQTHIKECHGSFIFICPYCNLAVRVRVSMRRHLAKKHQSLMEEWNNPKFIDNLKQISTSENRKMIQSDISNTQTSQEPLSSQKSMSSQQMESIIMSDSTTHTVGAQEMEIINAGQMILEDGTIISTRSQNESCREESKSAQVMMSSSGLRYNTYSSNIEAMEVLNPDQILLEDGTVISASSLTKQESNALQFDISSDGLIYTHQIEAHQSTDVHKLEVINTEPIVLQDGTIIQPAMEGGCLSNANTIYYVISGLQTNSVD